MAVVHHPARRDEFAALIAAPRAVTFVSVEWSGYERAGRPVFAELSELLAERHGELGVAFWILPEEWEGMANWFATCKPPVQSATGHGAVVWLERGRVVATEEHAARAGVNALVEQKLRLWAGPNQPLQQTAGAGRLMVGQHSNGPRRC
jgi:hypothetical protein